MKEFMMTFKFLIKQSLSFKYVIHRAKQDKKYRNMILLFVLVILMCTPSYILFISAFIELFEAFHTLMLDSLFIVLAIFMSLFFIMFFGMFQIISYFYFSNDVKLLTPLPIKPNHYLLSKFFVMYILELLVSVFVVLPIFIIYGIYQEIYLYQWLTMILAFLIMPIIPHVIIGILTIFLMNITNLVRSKDALRMIGYTILVIGLIAFQASIFSSLIPQDVEEQLDLFKELANNSSYFLDQFARYYPVAKLIDNAINGSFITAILSVSLLFIISMGFVYVFSYVLQTVFMKSYLKEQNSRFQKKRMAKQNINKSGAGNVSLSIAKIDFITLLKVPIYLFNTFFVVVLLPVLFIIYAFFIGAATDDEQLRQLLNLYQDNQNEFWLIIALFLVISNILIPIGSTSFSREGKTNWIMRTLPIQPKDHIYGRLLTPFITQIVFNIVIIVTFIVLLSTQTDTINEDIIYGIITFIISLIVGLPLLVISLFVDLTRPMLKWDNPQKAIKQNMNVIIMMGIGIIYASLLFVIYRYVLSGLGSPVLIYLVYIVIGLILSVISYRLLEKQFNYKLIVME